MGIFDSLKKAIARDAVTKTFKADLIDIKKADINVQKEVAKRIFKDINEAIKNGYEYQHGLLEQAKFERQLLRGQELKQNPNYANAALREAWHIAELSNDQVIHSAVTVPLLEWLKEFIPLIQKDEAEAKKNQVALKKVEFMKFKERPKVLIGNLCCDSCERQDVAEKFLISEAGNNFRKCHFCGTHFQIKNL